MRAMFFCAVLVYGAVDAISSTPYAQTTPAPASQQQTAPQTTPYDKDLLRLAEILGSLHYLRPLCNEPDGPEWRSKMQSLLDSEGEPVTRRNQLAGAFNTGYHAFQQTYTRCTESAHIVMRRFLSEGARLSRSLTERYGH